VQELESDDDDDNNVEEELRLMHELDGRAASATHSHSHVTGVFHDVVLLHSVVLMTA